MKYLTWTCVLVLVSVFSGSGLLAGELVPGTSYNVGDEINFVEGQPAPAAPAGYAWCLEKRKAVMETLQERVLVREASWYYETVPAQYEGKTETVMVEPEQKKAILVCPETYKEVSEQKLVEPATLEYKTIPAEYQWVEEEVEVAPARTEQIFIEAQYETFTEQVMVQPERTVREEVPGCDTDGTKIDCYSSRVIPAEYQTITKKRLIAPARTESRVIPAQKRMMRVRKVVAPARVEEVRVPAKYETVCKKVVDQPAQYRYETVPAKYKTIERKVLSAPETQRRVEIPARYETVTRMRVIKPERLVWVLKRSQNVTACPIGNTVSETSIIDSSSGGGDASNLVNRYGRVPGTASGR